MKKSLVFKAVLGLLSFAMLSCSNLNDSEAGNSEYGSITITNNSRFVDVKGIEKAKVTVSGPGMALISETVDIAGGKGTVAIKNIKYGKNRVIKVEAERTVESVLSKMEGVELYGFFDIEEPEISVEVSKNSTAKGKVLNYLYDYFKLQERDFEDFNASKIDAYLPEVSHPLFVNANKLAEDLSLDCATKKEDYVLKGGKVKFQLDEAFDGQAYLSDPVTEKIVALGTDNTINDVPQGTWNLYIIKDNTLLYETTLAVEEGKVSDVGLIKTVCPSPRFEDADGNGLKAYTIKKGESKQVYLACRTIDGGNPVDADIYYTTDGKTPTLESSRYSSEKGILISEKTTICAAAYWKGSWTESTKKTFTVEVEKPTDIRVFVSKSINDGKWKYIHYWSCSDKTNYPNTTWPGTEIKDVVEDDYVYTFKNCDSVSLLITDGAKSKLYSSDMSVTEPGDYRVSKSGIEGINVVTDDTVTILVEKYFGDASITYKACSNGEYKDGTVKLSELSDDGKDWVYVFENTKSVTVSKVIAGNNSSSEYKITSGGVYRAGWKKSSSGDDEWTDDKRSFGMFKTVLVSVKIEQKGDYQMYLCHYFHDDETQPVCDASRTAYWDSVPCGTELSESAGLNKENGSWIRKFRVAEGKGMWFRPTCGAYGSSAFVAGQYDKNKYETSYNVEGKEGASVTIKAADIDFETKTDGTGSSCTRPPLLTYLKDVNTGKQFMRLVWHGDQNFKWAKKNGSEKSVSGIRDSIGGKENGYYYDFTDLEPGETYYYIFAKVDGDKSNKKVYFKAPATETTGKYKYCVTGDSQSPEYANGNKGKYLSENMNILRGKSPAFMLSVGDLQNNGNQNASGNWQPMLFNGIVANLFDSGSESTNGYQIPFNAAPGNHDYSSSLFKDFLGMEQRYNAFNYGNSLFITVDVELENFNPGSKQYEFIENQLKNTYAKWKVIALHEGPYCYAPRHYSNYRVRKYLSPLFEKYGVSVVFSGHIHCYNHPKPVKGVEYINLPCMSSSPAAVSNAAPLVKQGMFEGPENGDGKFKDGIQGFGMVDVDGDVMTVTIYDSNKNVIDTIKINAK